MRSIPSHTGKTAAAMEHLPHDGGGSSEAGSSCYAVPRVRKARKPFRAAEHKPEAYDGIFRVLLISSGSVASVKVPDIVGALSRDPHVAVQVVATASSMHFYSQEAVDATAWREEAARRGRKGDQAGNQTIPENFGVRIWRDADEWSDWKAIGDPILHIELRRWADLVVVAPCSADFLAKVAGGLCDNLALSILRAITPDTPVLLCPAMNTHMYQHRLTADHLKVVRDKLGYRVSGPQGAGTLACGDEGPGKMTDWRDIVLDVQDSAAIFHAEAGSRAAVPNVFVPSQEQQSRTASQPQAFEQDDSSISPVTAYKPPDLSTFAVMNGSGGYAQDSDSGVYGARLIEKTNWYKP